MGSSVFCWAFFSAIFLGGLLFWIINSWGIVISFHFNNFRVKVATLSDSAFNNVVSSKLRYNIHLGLGWYHKDSLLAMIRMNILDGLIYFNCCPNYSVDLNDPLNIDILLSDIHHPNMHKKGPLNCTHFITTNSSSEYWK